MQNDVIKSYSSIQLNINKIKKADQEVKIISVSKTFSMEKILPLIKNGNIHFGENKVQEATHKWTNIKNEYPKIKLHMIGKLQSNKSSSAIKLFDYIHSLDNQKLADTLHKHEINNNKKLKYFIQVNVGNENQKSGITTNLIDQFYNYCTKEINLNVIGLMAIPPIDGNIAKHFNFLYEANASLGLTELSIGMSNDYVSAIKNNATYLRIGSAIFGKRN